MGHAPSPIPRTLPPGFIANQVKKGEIRNPSGSRCNGRGKAIAILDALMASEKNSSKLRKAFQAAFDKNPLYFFQTVVAPLIPKEARLTMDAGAGGVQWASLLTMFPTKASAESITVEASASETSVAAVAGERPSLAPPSYSIPAPADQVNMAG